MKDFLAELNSSLKLGLNAAAKEIYSRDSEGKYAAISTFSCLLHEHKYYVFTDIDELPVNTPSSSLLTSPERDLTTLVSTFSNMDEFYRNLGAKGCTEEDIGIIRNAFDGERIRVGSLPRLNDQDLRDLGLSMGLCEIIMVVLGK
jgi:hypothetical protein